jgi:hypothetical protein
MAQVLLLSRAFTGSGSTWSAVFDLPQEPPEGRSDKIYFFAPAQSCGGELLVNGRPALQFQAGQRLFADLTGDLTESRPNRIDTVFYQNHAWQGDVGLRMTSFAYFDAVETETTTGMLYLRLTVCAQVRGVFRLRIRVHLDSEQIAGYNVDLNLIASRQDITVKVPMPDAAPWHPGDNAPAYLVRLFLQRGGLGCDSIQTAAVFGAIRFSDDRWHDAMTPLFLCAAAPAADCPQLLPLWQRAGINAVVAPACASVSFLYACMRAGMVLLAPDGRLSSGGFAASRESAQQSARLVPLGAGRRTRPQLLRSRIWSLRTLCAAGVILQTDDIPLCADALMTPSVWLSFSKSPQALSGRAMAMLPAGFSGRLYVQGRLYDAVGARIAEITWQPQSAGGGLITCGRFETPRTDAFLAQLSVYVSGRMIAFCSQQLAEAPVAACADVHFVRSGGACYLCNDGSHMQCGLYLTDAAGTPVLTSPALIDLRPWEKQAVRVLWPEPMPQEIQIHTL